MRLQNKIGIVTAAGSGMGRAGALRFAQEGAAVAVVDLNETAAAAVVQTIADAGGRAIALAGDLRNDDFARSIVRETTRAFGALDFVWNHVGHPGPAAIEGVDWSEFELAMDLNVRTVLVTTEAALPELRARGGGALLFTASTSGSPARSSARSTTSPNSVSLAWCMGWRNVMREKNPRECGLPRPSGYADAEGVRGSAGQSVAARRNPRNRWS